MKTKNDNTVLRLSVLMILTLICVQGNSQSLANSHPAMPRYHGYELSMGFPNLRYSSDHQKLERYDVSFAGGSVGVVAANPVGKVKALIGLYYSDASMPRSVDLYESSISTSLYLLRLNSISYHTFEPYASIEAHYQQNRFFGDYIASNSTQPMMGDEAYVGSMHGVRLGAGIGVEYQLENATNDFIHFFIEAKLNSPLHQEFAGSLFENTSVAAHSMVVFGVSFGKIK